MDRAAVADVVRQSILAVLPGTPTERIVDDKQLVDLGANSIDRAEIVMLSLESLSLSVPSTRLAAAKNIGTLIDLLASAKGALP